MARKISIIGPCISWDGYGCLVSSIVAGEQDIGYDSEVISTWAVQRQGIDPRMLAKLISIDDKKAPYSLYVCDMTGNPVDYDNEKKLHFTMWECSRLKRSFVDKMNSNLCVIVPCSWNKRVFEESKVKVPIAVVPLGIDENVYSYAPPPEGKFVFGAGGNIGLGGGKRKQLHEIVRLFVRAFPSERDVALVVKTDKGSEFPRYADPRIKVIGDYLSEKQMAKWYASFHAFVSVSSGEGWGYMPQKAMARGRPAIMPKFGGVTEYFDETVGIPLAHKLGPATGYYASTEGEWAYYDRDDLVDKMRWAFQNREKLNDLGAKASARAREFSIKRMLASLKEVLNYYIP